MMMTLHVPYYFHCYCQWFLLHLYVFKILYTVKFLLNYCKIYCSLMHCNILLLDFERPLITCKYENIKSCVIDVLLVKSPLVFHFSVYRAGFDQIWSIFDWSIITHTEEWCNVRIVSKTLFCCLCKNQFVVRTCLQSEDILCPSSFTIQIVSGTVSLA